MGKQGTMSSARALFTVYDHRLYNMGIAPKSLMTAKYTTEGVVTKKEKVTKNNREVESRIEIIKEHMMGSTYLDDVTKKKLIRKVGNDHLQIY